MMIKILVALKLFKGKHTINFVNIVRNNLHTHTSEVPVKEIHIPVQWGHVAAKLWGSEQDRPILAVHGWQDNAGTWDTLAPLLVKNTNRSILAIDFPGHGLSSWFPSGMHYYNWENVRLILHIKEFFKWDKVSIISHSLGSITSFHYTCLFNKDVDFLVVIDTFISEEFSMKYILERHSTHQKKILSADARSGQEPPSYTWDDITNLWHLSTGKSVSLENVHHLLKRGAKHSAKDPNKYYLTRDPKVKYIFFKPENKEFIGSLIPRLHCPILYIKPEESHFALKGLPVIIRKELEINNDKFESHYLPGTHHIHLNNPEIVLPVMLKFFEKHKLL